MAEIHFYSDEEKQNEIYPAIDPAGVYPSVTVGFANNLTSSSKIVSETKFNYRNTGGNENVLDGEATINNIKGSVNCTTRKETCTMEVNSTTIAAEIDVDTFRNKVQGAAVNYTFTYIEGAWKLNNNIITIGEYGISISGNPNANDSIIVHYLPVNIGNITIAKPTKITSIKFNQFNKESNDKLFNYYIDDNGDVKAGKPDASTNTYGIIWFKCIGGQTYTIYNKDEYPIYRVVWHTSAPTTTSRGLTLLSPSVTAVPYGQTLVNSPYLQYYTPAENGYLCVVPTTGIDNLCCHLTGSGDEDTVYEDYAEDSFNFDIEYTLRDNNNQIIFENGLLQVEDFYDEIDYKTGILYKRIKRGPISMLSTVVEAGWPYIFDAQYVYYYDGNVQEITKDEILNKNTNYTVGTFGTEQFINTSLEIPVIIQYPLNLKGIIQQISKNKINILNIKNGNSQGSLRNINAIEEDNSYSLGINAFAEGDSSKAAGDYSHAEGYHTIAKGEIQHVEGQYNIEDSANTYVHIIGNGSAQTASNLHTVDWNGNAWYQGDVYVQSTSGTNKDAGSKKLITRDEAPMIYSGSTEPSNALGKDGDLFVLIDA